MVAEIALVITLVVVGIYIATRKRKNPTSGGSGGSGKPNNNDDTINQN
jgi:hypothetical protein